MALTWAHVRTLDEQRRLAIPKAFRDLFCTDGATTARLVVAPGMEQALALFSVEQFQKRANEVRACARDNQDIRTFLRLYFSQAESVDIDKQGRIRPSERLMQFADIQQEAVLLGVNDRVEIGDHARWERFMKKHGQLFDQMVQGF